MERAETIKNIEELANLANVFLNELQANETQATIVALHGDLGAGKTAFVQEMGKILGVQETITSPTFTIMRQYDVESEKFDSLVHIDAYRLESENEIGPLKIAELLTKSKTLICIEWADRLGSVLGEQTIHLAFTINEDESRTVKIGQNGRT